MAYVIFDIERTFDERVCRTAQDVRDFINGADLSRSHFKVLELDDAPDVTDQFQVPEPEPVEEYPETFNRRQYMRRIGSPGW